ncbi:MAG TPA: methylated-DNA--[protein]-cysteine S-methyltransferase [Magnetospirillaceae bacterium]|jgi:methylated-DNA-[protein]-cysteine S-methyltransferase
MEPTLPYISFDTPLGDYTVFEESGAIVVIESGRAAGGKPTRLLNRTRKQIDEYFDRKRKRFEIPIAPPGTPYQVKVWNAIIRIPYGQTRSYGDIAHDTDSGPRAVGTACRECPISILIPCHRVIGAGGRIGGWSSISGLDGKRALLRLEGAL